MEIQKQLLFLLCIAFISESYGMKKTHVKWSTVDLSDFEKTKKIKLFKDIADQMNSAFDPEYIQTIKKFNINNNVFFDSKNRLGHEKTQEIMENLLAYNVVCFSKENRYIGHSEEFVDITTLCDAIEENLEPNFVSINPSSLPQNNTVYNNNNNRVEEVEKIEPLHLSHWQRNPIPCLAAAFFAGIGALKLYNMWRGY